MTRSASSSRQDALNQLYARPGFIFRRAHQIATSIFLECSASLGTTTTQYGVLTVLQCSSGSDQITVARLLGLDRSTAGLVIHTLVAAGYVARDVATDKRKRSLHLTPSGVDLLNGLHNSAATAKERLLAPLDASERRVLLRLLSKLTAAHNGGSRVPVFDAG